jgi:uncharacterized protein YndB with AHSA1/START domain
VLTVPSPVPPVRALSASRVIFAPRARVFRAWTDPAQLAKWWGADGCSAVDVELDARPGGIVRVRARGPGGVESTLAGVFLSIVEPVRLSFTDALAEDAKPYDDAILDATFDLHDGATLLAVRARFTPVAGRDAQSARAWETAWRQSLEKLARCLASA